MLPIETTADIFSFLRLFDLSGPFMTSKGLSDIACICSKRMKDWSFRVIRLRSYVSDCKGHTQVGMFTAVVCSSELPVFSFAKHKVFFVG